MGILVSAEGAGAGSLERLMDFLPRLRAWRRLAQMAEGFSTMSECVAHTGSDDRWTLCLPRGCGAD
jgi:hypothetical protein